MITRGTRSAANTADAGSSAPDGEPGAPAPARSRWRARNWRIRTKMAVVLLVPTVTALTLGGLRIATEIDTAGRLHNVVTQVDAARAITGAVHALHRERIAAAAGRAGDAAAQYGRTDAALATLRTALRDVRAPDDASRFRYDSAASGLTGVADQRRPGLAATTAFAGYTAIIGRLEQLATEIAGVSGPPRIGAAAQALGRAKEHAAQVDALVLIAMGRGRFGSADALGAAREQAAGFGSSIADFTAVADPADANFYITRYRGEAVDTRDRLLRAALSTPDAAAPVRPVRTDLLRAALSADDIVRDVELRVLADLRTATVAQADAATAAAIRDGVLMFLAILLAVLLMLRVASWLIVPLRALHRGAYDVANRTLPETVRRVLADPAAARTAAATPVPVSSTDEIGEVARSIDAVQRQAVRMAAEQALLRDNIGAIFVNLSRRSQALIERQLNELDRLEQEDPAYRGRLFQLDHLVARLRRNSENLLILSGQALVRRSSRPLPVHQVVEAAVSEIEDYRRVQLTGMPAVYLQGRVINDVVHLIAELLDNATVFSPSDRPVTVAAAMTGSGLLAVHIGDAGMGLRPEELRSLNADLAQPPEFEVSLSRRMGLYVVATLASRHGIQVRLRSNEPTEPAEPAGPGEPGDLGDRGDIGGNGATAGVTAVVTVPATLLTDPPPTPPPGTPDPAAPARPEPVAAAPGTGPAATDTAPESPASPEFDALPGTLRSAEALRERLSGLQRGLIMARAWHGADEPSGPHPDEQHGAQR